MDNNKAPLSPIHRISKTFVRQSSASASESGESKRKNNLTPWDLWMLSVHYTQRGLLFPKPANIPIHLTCLESSLSQTLHHFFPLSGRLATTHHTNTVSPHSVSISVDCNDEGVELIVAKAETVSAADVLACEASLLRSLFPLNDVIGHDGHSLPLLSVQLTELADSVFLAFSINHAVVDDTSLWHFINSWSETSRSIDISLPPSLDRWFLDHISPPLHLPVDDGLQLRLPRYDPSPHAEAYFYFSAKTIADLKARANSDAINKDVQVSSLQALLAHLWRSVSRARKLLPDQETSYFLAAGSRGRIRPPLPTSYFGNAVLGVTARVLVGELAEKGLGWVARQLNQAVAEHGDGEIRKALLAMSKLTPFADMSNFTGNNMMTGSSPRFKVFENDFGWGRPIAVRSGPGNKVDGMATAFPCRRERDGVGFHLYLAKEAMSSLLDDAEFIDTTSSEFEET